MNRKTKIVAIVLIAIADCLVIGNPIVCINNQKSQKSVKNINDETVQLNDVVPFEWDALYTFGPYQSKESIEEIVGFKSADIKENTLMKEWYTYFL